ncbi:uncharacterized protein I303_107160 [Kwoniella dejecticola CBS 10117]|uniref:ABC transporter domain-containing protein n=1 Tax=Kwoniella dejecticola CBS 10117 TaxID=1296121 RepID=A0A1A5ZYW5_9TREE|nr:uncharacterized protein I303_06561 [Kwoniella dejecticola CBS 10117]OBR83003.1 hypothetical protein I303_06561 [Kwoniella dejecticola CBS 10117]
MSGHLPLVRFPPNALIHRLGSPNTSKSTALLRFPERGWTINTNSESNKKEGWAIVGDSEGRKLAVETLLSRHKIHPLPPTPGPFPFISTLSTSKSESENELNLSTHKPIRHLGFSRPSATGEFTDFTARYGALQEEDRLSFRQTLLTTIHPAPHEGEIERVMGLMGIEKLLDLPNVSLSSGQTRRARIALSLLTKPVLLILEDPMSGLDVKSRKEVSDILGNLNAKGEIRVIVVVRDKNLDNLPEWITDVAEIKAGEVWIGNKDEYLQHHQKTTSTATEAKIEEVKETKGTEVGKEVVKLDKVSVSYGEGSRPVLKEICWTIREGEKWHLVGANGSGKTTLLSLILGHHPRSYSLPSSALTLFDKARREISTVQLKSMIGHTSPEIFIAFPRNMGLSAYQTIGSGFKGIFTRSQLDEKQKERVLGLLDQVKDLLQPATNAAIEETQGMSLRDIALKEFSHFTPSQQNLLLFLRAIVGRPNLLILDEPSQGVDEVVWERCKAILKDEWESDKKMATIAVSHYEDEVPWSKGQGKIIKLDNGQATLE